MRPRFLLLALGLAFLVPSPSSARSYRGPRQRTPSPVGAATGASVRMPVHFEANEGQAGAGVDFVARSRSMAALLSREGAVLSVGGFQSSPRRAGFPVRRDELPGISALVTMRFSGIEEGSRLAGVGALPGRSHYLIGNDPKSWVRDVAQYSLVEQRGAWPGIDVLWRASDRQLLRYDFLVSPGADPSRIALRFGTANPPSIDGEGNLVLETPAGAVIHRAPVAWQWIGSSRRSVECAFAVAGDGLTTFRLGPWSREHALTIDPEIDYSTFLYSEEEDFGLDSAGAIYVCGSIYSPLPFQLVNAYQGTLKGPYDGYVMKLDPTGTTIQYATYIGGSSAGGGDGYDFLYGLAIDGGGRAVVGGYSSSTNYPVTAGAIQSTRAEAGSNNNKDCILSMLSASGSSLVWSTYLGGNGTDGVDDILIAPNGDVVIYGLAGGANFPLKDAAQATYGGNEDTFVAVVDAAGTALLRSTYLGGSANDRCVRARFDGQGRLCLFGATGSSNFPVKSPYQATMGGAGDTYFARFAEDGKSFETVSFFGGSGADWGADMCFDRNGDWVITGTTNSTSFPLLNPLQSQFGGGYSDAFVAVLDKGLASLKFSTYLGGTDYDEAGGVFVDPAGTTLVVGTTRSGNFPLVAPQDSTLDGGKEDVFITSYATNRTSITWSTFYGGAGADAATRLESTLDYDVWVQVEGTGTSFPLLNGFLSSGDDDALFRINFPSLFTPPPTNLQAQLLSLTSIRLTWNDPGNLETGFRVQRSVDAGGWEDPVTIGANVTGLDVSGLAPEGSYEFRVSAFNDLAESAYSEPVFITMPSTPVLPPADPSNLQVAVLSPREALLTWQDNSDNEDFFLLARAEGSGLFTTLATPGLGTTSFTDDSLLPERTYSWKVRCQNPVGTSLFSNTVSVTLPSTLEVAITKGKIVDKADVISKDAVTLAGTLGYVEGSQHAVFDPSNQSFTLRIGAFGDPAILSIPVPADGWVLKKGKYNWKSPKGSAVKAKVSVDPAAFTWTVKLTGLTLAVPTTNPLRVTLTLGTDTGHIDGDWTAPTKSGVIKFPVPVPK